MRSLFLTFARVVQNLRGEDLIGRTTEHISSEVLRLVDDFFYFSVCGILTLVSWKE